MLSVLKNPAYHFKRISLSQWLFSALAEAGFPVICVETRHMQAVLKAQINKTDRNDARGIAQMMRVGLYRPVHVKTLRSQKLRMLLTHRKLLQSKAIAIENDLRGTLRNFGLKVGMVGTVRFEARIKELVENLPDLAALVEPLLVVRRTLREQFCILHRRLLAIVRDDEVCRRLMTTPGVGPVVSLTYRATVDVPARFRKSKAVGAVVALTMQTAYLSPPVAMSAYYLKQVVKDWSLGTIYKGMFEFMTLQCVAIALLVAFPAIATWFPEHQRREASKVQYEKVDDSKNILEEDPFEQFRRQQRQQGN